MSNVKKLHPLVKKTAEKLATKRNITFEEAVKSIEVTSYVLVSRSNFQAPSSSSKKSPTLSIQTKAATLSQALFELDAGNDSNMCIMHEISRAHDVKFMLPAYDIYEKHGLLGLIKKENPPEWDANAPPGMGMEAPPDLRYANDAPEIRHYHRAVSNAEIHVDNREVEQREPIHYQDAFADAVRDEEVDNIDELGNIEVRNDPIDPNAPGINQPIPNAAVEDNDLFAALNNDPIIRRPRL